MLLWNTDGRKHGLAFLAILADDQVAAAEILEVVREGTERAENGIGIPAGLEFDSLDFHDSNMKQVVDPDRQATDKNARRSLAFLCGGLR